MQMLERPAHLSELILTWQDPAGRRRSIVGRACLSDDGSATFRYVEGEELDRARASGFEGYPAFPPSSATYTSGVLESFASRLARPSRTDYAKYLEYWFVSPESKPTPFDLLGYTGATLPRDGFRFLPVLPKRGVFDFVTEVAGARYYDWQGVRVGERVSFRPEPGNERDPSAVEVIRDDGRRLGYVLRGMNEQFLTWLSEGEVKGEIARVNGTESRPVILLHVWVIAPERNHSPD